MSQASQEPPREFQEALSSLRRTRIPPELKISEIPTPKQLAPFSISFSAEVTAPDEPEKQLATGRFVLLHEQNPPASWGGNFRAVTYIRAAVEPDVGEESMLCSVAWDWLTDCLIRHEAQYIKAGGTATRSFSQGFGTLGAEAEIFDIEMRASWTPQGPDMQRHLEAWVDVISTYAGLEPLPEDVARFPLNRPA